MALLHQKWVLQINWYLHEDEILTETAEGLLKKIVGFYHALVHVNLKISIIKVKHYPGRSFYKIHIRQLYLFLNVSRFTQAEHIQQFALQNITL